MDNSVTERDPIAGKKTPVEMLPLKGEVCVQFTRCGKARCRCARGKLHGPYFYRVWREGNRVHKLYVRQEHVEAVKEACHVYRSLDAELKLMRRRRQTLSRQVQRDIAIAGRLLAQID